MRVLTLRELNRATLTRQLLLRRQRVGLLPAVARVGGLQAQFSPAPYVGLWTRLEGFRRASLERALGRQQILKATLMRATLHLVTARDYPVFAAALHGGEASPINPDAIAFAERVVDGVLALFADGPRTRGEVFEWLGSQQDGDVAKATPWMAWYAIRARAHIVHAPPSAFWKAPQRPRFVALADVGVPDIAGARRELVRRYLAAFGPATRADIADWSGMRVRDFAGALDELEPLRRFRDEQGRELLDLPRAPLPAPETPAPVRFLPKWDSLLLGHADRRRVLPEEYRKVVIRKNGDVDQTFLVDGVVAGTWALERGRVRVRAFAPLPRAARRELEDEAARLEAFVR